MESKKQFWVGFNLVKGIGPARLRKLLDFFGDIEEAWKANSKDLRAAGLGTKLIKRLQSVRETVDLPQVLAKSESNGISILTWEDVSYPGSLLEIDGPPPVIYVRGTLQEIDRWAVAIVGSRRMTRYGRQITHDLAAYLSRNGITVVSGLARGVDAVAHQAAIDGGGRTLAVLGSGVDRIYPPENRQLALDIMSAGAVVSDYAPGTPPDGANFPPRNRIISGLSLATVVVEAGKTSGALITARFAVDQGRDVFAVPGNITSPMSEGPNRLILDGAHPLTHPEQLLEMLNLSRVTEHREAVRTLPINELETSIMETVGYEPVHIDEICARLKLSVEKVSPNLTLMELKGMIRQVGGMNYVAVREAAAAYSI